MRKYLAVVGGIDGNEILIKSLKESLIPVNVSISENYRLFLFLQCSLERSRPKSTTRVDIVGPPVLAALLRVLRNLI